MYKGSWTKNVFLFGISLLIMYVIAFILGLFNYCSWFINCFVINFSSTLLRSVILFWYQTSTTMGNYEMQERWLLRGWFCSMWLIGKAPWVCWLLCCCLLALLAGGLVVWWGCDAVWYWIAGGTVLAWFQESVSDLSHLLVSCHTSIIVVYSMLC